MGFKLLAFDSTHESLKAEDILMAKNIAVNPIPIPRSLRIDCSLGLRIKDNDMEKTEEILKKENINYYILPTE